MPTEPVRFPPSTNIGQIEYDKETQTLVIQFKSGRVYQYHPVDEQTARGFESCLSAGDYFNMFIKPLSEMSRLK